MSISTLSEGYIDHNGNLTNDMIYQGQEAHGEHEIRAKLFNLLRRHDESRLVQIEERHYPETFANYKKVTKTDVEWVGKVPIAFSREIDLWLSDEESETDPYPWVDMVEFKAIYPLRYLVRVFLCTYDARKMNSFETVKSATSKQLREILNDYVEYEDSKQLQHEQRVIDMSLGCVYDIGG